MSSTMPLERAEIGGSDVAAILGVSAYKDNTAYQWWRRKMGLDPPVHETMRMKAGKALEDDLTAWYQAKTGVQLAPCPLIVDPEEPWFGGNPDRVSRDGRRVVELKMVGFRVAMKLGEPGTDDVVPDHLLQARTYEGLLRLHGSPIEAVDWVYWCWDWPEPVLYSGDADADIYFMIRARVKLFKELYLDTQTPPPLDGSEAAAKHLKELFPREAAGRMIVADQNIDELCARLREITEQGWAIEDEEAKIKQALQYYMGDAEILSSQVGKFSWKFQPGRTDYKAYAEALDPGLPRAEEFRGEGSRVFRTPFRRGR